ncbi:MAG: hypothetical protein ACK57X_12795, partial [Bacteroidota bacterium]
MKQIKYLFLAATVLYSTACQDLVQGINDNPNAVPIEAVSAVGFLTGAQLANIQVQLGHEQRIVSSWSGHYVGY